MKHSTSKKYKAKKYKTKKYKTKKYKAGSSTHPKKGISNNNKATNNYTYSRKRSNNDILTLLVIEDEQHNGETILKIAHIYDKKRIHAPKYVNYVFNPKNLEIQRGKINLEKIKSLLSNNKDLKINSSNPSNISFSFFTNDKNKPLISRTNNFKGLTPGEYLMLLLKQNYKDTGSLKKYFKSLFKRILYEDNKGNKGNKDDKDDKDNKGNKDNIEVIYLSANPTGIVHDTVTPSVTSEKETSEKETPGKETTEKEIDKRNRAANVLTRGLRRAQTKKLPPHPPAGAGTLVAKQNKTPKSFTLMTYNVYQNRGYSHSAKCKSKASNYINDMHNKPTIICTQEEPAGGLHLKDYKRLPICPSSPHTAETVAVYYKTDEPEPPELLKCVMSEERHAIIFKYMNIKIANLHLAGGKYTDKELAKDFENELKKKMDLLNSVIKNSPDIIIGDFNSVYSSSQPRLKEFLTKQNKYFKELNQFSDTDKIEQWNLEPYKKLQLSNYNYATPENENNTVTSASGMTIVDTIWYKSPSTCKNTKITDTFNRDCSPSDHNPVTTTVEIVPS